MPPAAEAIGVPARAAKSRPAWKACECANGSMRLPNVDVSSAPAIGSRVGSRIKRERLLGGGARDRWRSAARSGRAGRRSRRAATTSLALGQQRPAGGAGGLAPAACVSRPPARAARRRVGVDHADPLAQLRRFALEAEQARRDRADLLERERQRQRLGRGATADGSGRTAPRRASSRARRPRRASASAATPARAISGRTGRVLTRDRLVAPVAIITNAMPIPFRPMRRAVHRRAGRRP